MLHAPSPHRRLRTHRLHRATLFPYTTLFRSRCDHGPLAGQHWEHDVQPLFHAAERPTERVAPLRPGVRWLRRLTILGWGSDRVASTPFRDSRLWVYTANIWLGEFHRLVLPSQRCDRRGLRLLPRFDRGRDRWRRRASTTPNSRHRTLPHPGLRHHRRTDQRPHPPAS